MIRPATPPANWVPPGLAQLFEIVLDAAARGRLDSDELEMFESAGAAAADTGASLSLLIDAYLRGAGELWEHLFTETSGVATTVELGRVLRQISEQAVAALAGGFEMAQRRNIRAEETARRELIETLLLGDPVDELWFADQARQTGFPVRGPYQVAVGIADDALGDADPIQSQLERDLGQRYAATGWVALIRRGELVVIAAGPHGLRVSGLDDALSKDRSREWHVGVGDLHDGVPGIEASYRQAREAQRIGRTFGRDRVTAHSEIPIERLLSGHRAVVAELGSRVVAPLAEAGRGDLLETLAVYLGCGGNTAEAARRLSVGSRTVGYRLERISELTGCSPRNPDDRLLLELAMRARPLMANV